MADDLKSVGLGDFDWNGNGRAASINRLVQHCRQCAERASNWYLSKKTWPKRGALATRTLAILLTSAGGLLPIVSLVISNESDSVRISPAWTTLSLAAAAAVLGLDKFFGYSRGWARFITTHTRISGLLDEFELEWPQRMSTWVDGHPNDAQTAEALLACRQFVVKINDLVAAETAQWVASFEETLRALDAKVDEAAKSHAAEAAKREHAQTAIATASRPGALNLSITNSDAESVTWRVECENGAPQDREGRSVGLRSVPPGIVSIRVEGVIAGRTCSISRAEKVEPDQVRDLSFTLE